MFSNPMDAKEKKTFMGDLAGSGNKQVESTHLNPIGIFLQVTYNSDASSWWENCLKTSATPNSGFKNFFQKTLNNKFEIHLLATCVGRKKIVIKYNKMVASKFWIRQNGRYFVDYLNEANWRRFGHKQLNCLKILFVALNCLNSGNCLKTCVTGQSSDTKNIVIFQLISFWYHQKMVIQIPRSD